MSQEHTKSKSRIYSLQNRAGINPFGAASAIAREIATHRSHIGTMFSAEFKSTYRGTVLGVFWNFALPLVPITVYILLVSLKVFPTFEGLAPAVYISFNVTLWMFLVGMISRPINIVKQRTQETMKTSLPLSAAISSSFSQLIFETLIRLVLVAGLVVAFGPIPSANIPMLFIAILAGVTLCLSIGLILAIFNMVYSDIDRLVSIFLQYAIFLSGVIFPISTLGPLSVTEHYNPFNVVIQSARDYLFFGTHAGTHALWIWSGIAIGAFLIALRFFYVMEHRIREAVR